MKAVAFALACSISASGPPSGLSAAEPTAGQSLVRGAAIEAVKSPDLGVRLAAIRSIGKIGTVGDVRLLADLAATGPDAEKAAAAQSLVTMRQPGVNAALVELLKAEPKLRPTVIRSLAERRDSGSLAAVIGFTTDADPAVRAEAAKALQLLADEKSVPTLVGLLAKASGAERESLEQAIVSACRAIPETQRRAQPLLALLASADAPRRALLLPVVGYLGGKEAREAVVSARQDADERVREAAITALCNWPEADVTDDLLALAKAATSPQQRTAAVRALARVVPRSQDQPPPEKTRVLQEAFALAQQVDDKRLILSRLATVRTPEALATAVSSTDVAELRDEAIKAVVELSRVLWSSHQQAARQALEKILPMTNDPDLKLRIDRIINNPDEIRKGKAS